MTDYTLDFSEDSVGPTIDYSGSNGRIGIDDSIPAGVGATKSVSWFWRNSLDSNNTNYYFELPITLAADGVVSFYRRTSTESGFDWLRFYIDGSPPANSIWSGETAWGQSSFNLTAGAHTLRWAFTRDGSGISGSNTCWVALINVTNVVTAPPVRNSGHTAATYDFEDGNVPAVLTTSTWINSTDSPITGTRSMRSPLSPVQAGSPVDHDLVVDTTALTENGALGFDYKKDSEAADIAQFIVNGVEVWKSNTATEGPWRIRPILAAGTTSFTIRYRTDGFGAVGANAVWIDNLRIPYSTAASTTASRVLTEYVEAASTGTPASRVGTEYVEAASTGTPARRMGTEYVEAASTGTPARRLATGYLEVLTPTAPQALTVDFKHREAGAWVARTAAPKVRVAGAWVTIRPQRWDGASWVDLT